MPILNYTTTISISKTVGKIQEKLASAKAKAIMTEYDNEGVLSSMSFKISLNGKDISFRLPANIDKVQAVIAKDKRIPYRLKSREQAARVAWRIIKDWVEAQIAIVETEMVELPEVFLPYAETKKGNTLYEEIKNNTTGLLLTYQK